MTSNQPSPSLDVFENFPGFERVTDLLEQQMLRHGAKNVADIGGGANPRMMEKFIRANNINYTMIDISREELDKAPAHYRKICIDISAPAEEFAAALGDARFDFVFSHMVLEHLKDPVRAHENINSALTPGGVAVHLYPTSNNAQLMLNRLLPESVTRILVRIAQPNRDMDVYALKFPAFYRMCANPSQRFHRKLAKLKFRVLEHIGYVGHDYYKKFPVVRNIERWLRPLIVRAKLPFTSYAVLVLQKPVQ